MSLKDRIANKYIRECVEWVEVLVIAFVLAMIIKEFIVETTEISGPSMNPTLYQENRLLVNRFIYKFTNPKRGDIIVFLPDNDNKNYIKRIIALPGETVDLIDGKVFIDGNELDEEYLSDDVRTYRQSNSKDFPYTLADDEYLAFGDNRERSLDCRSEGIGKLTKEKIRGKAICRIYPFNQMRLFETVRYDIDQNESKVEGVEENKIVE